MQVKIIKIFDRCPAKNEITILKIINHESGEKYGIASRLEPSLQPAPPNLHFGRIIARLNICFLCSYFLFVSGSKLAQCTKQILRILLGFKHLSAVVAKFVGAGICENKKTTVWCFHIRHTWRWLLVAAAVIWGKTIPWHATLILTRAANDPSVFTITEKAPTID